MNRLFPAMLTTATMLLMPSLAWSLDGVVTTIKPVHSLVSAVMGDTGTPVLLLDGQASPHTYTLKPSQARLLENASIVFWIGPDMETFLDRPLQTLSAGVKQVLLSQASGVTLLDIRDNAAFEPDMHEHHEDHGHEEHDDHEHRGSKDMHIWLDPANARAMVQTIAHELTLADPDNAETYQNNARTVAQQLQKLTSDTQTALEGFSDTPFYVFHDAYHYFEHRFDIHASGSIVLSPDTPPSARRIKDIHQRIAQTPGACVFSEPQFDSHIINALLTGTTARTAVLDPLGIDIDAGPDQYFTLIGNLTTALTTCLKGE